MSGRIRLRRNFFLISFIFLRDKQRRIDFYKYTGQTFAILQSCYNHFPKMKSIVVFVVFATLLAVASAQNAPAVNWAQVRPIHQVPSFFRDYPFLFNLFGSFNPSQWAWEEEGRNATRNQYPYQVYMPRKLFIFSYVNSQKLFFLNRLDSF